MAYKLKESDPTLGDAVRRIALDQVTRARAEAEDPALAAPQAIHQIRKRCKKLRGLLRLVRPGFAAYAEENAAIRDLARRLSGLRDLEALIETHDRLMARDEAEPARFAPVRAALTQRKQAAPERVDDDTREALDALAGRIAGWEIGGKPAKVIAGGLEKTWRRAAKAHADCRDAPTTDAMHEWRKRVKYHWYHCRILAPVWPGPVGARAEEAKRLSDILGDHHDLALYAAHLASEDAPRLAPEAQTALGRITDRALAELERDAFALGARFFAEKPKRASKRLAALYSIWESEPRR
ncbi:CHAD domain-containing protein [Rhodosalinus sp.]|uniref:CHAD domain-containing protein n=1 Tax=Rhodosalinus sp. TaxID=2047741 RepID=UPI0035636E13